MYGVSGMRELGGPSDVLFDLFANKKRQTVHIDYFLSVSSIFLITACFRSS